MFLQLKKKNVQRRRQREKVSTERVLGAELGIQFTIQNNSHAYIDRNREVGKHTLDTDGRSSSCFSVLLGSVFSRMFDVTWISHLKEKEKRTVLIFVLRILCIVCELYITAEIFLNISLLFQIKKLDYDSRIGLRLRSFHPYLTILKFAYILEILQTIQIYSKRMLLF